MSQNSTEILVLNVLLLDLRSCQTLDPTSGILNQETGLTFQALIFFQALEVGIPTFISFTRCAVSCTDMEYEFLYGL